MVNKYSAFAFQQILCEYKCIINDLVYIQKYIFLICRDIFILKWHTFTIISHIVYIILHPSIQ